MSGASPGRTGVWLVGACGNVGVTVVVGAAAVARGLTPATGLLTEAAPVRSLPLPALRDLVFGGHEIRTRTLVEAAEEAAGPGGFLPRALVAAVEPELSAAQERVRRGTLLGTVPALRDRADVEAPADRDADAAVSRLSADIARFREDASVARVVVVNVASTEPRPDPPPADRDALPASSLYALAAAAAGCPFVNFTPSLGADCPAARAALDAAGLPHCGADGKTGETLVKAALAPMFAVRALHVMSWSGQNLLGNLDGAVLSDPASRETKVRSKSGVLAEVLGYEPESRVGIDYVGSLGDFKVAWDLIHFRGFLEVPMRLQFVWEGCDSVLAAPLVLDLARLVAWAHARGERGALGWLASFFKAPLGPHAAGLVDQHRALLDHLGLSGPP